MAPSFQIQTAILSVEKDCRWIIDYISWVVPELSFGTLSKKYVGVTLCQWWFALQNAIKRGERILLGELYIPQFNSTNYFTLIRRSFSTRIKCQTFSVAIVERNSDFSVSFSSSRRSGNRPRAISEGKLNEHRFWPSRLRIGYEFWRNLVYV